MNCLIAMMRTVKNVLDTRRALMKHKLVLIGFLGDFTAYLDVPQDEARRRYIANGGGATDGLKELEFDDQFYAYDAQQNEP